MRASLEPWCFSPFGFAVWLILSTLPFFPWSITHPSISNLDDLMSHSVEKLSGFSAAVLTERFVDRDGGFFSDSLCVYPQCINRSDSGLAHAGGSSACVYRKDLKKEPWLRFVGRTNCIQATVGIYMTIRELLNVTKGWNTLYDF